MKPNNRAIEFFVLTSSQSRQEAASLLAVAPDINVQVTLVEALGDQVPLLPVQFPAARGYLHAHA